MSHCEDHGEDYDSDTRFDHGLHHGQDRSRLGRVVQLGIPGRKACQTRWALSTGKAKMGTQKQEKAQDLIAAVVLRILAIRCQCGVDAQ